MLGVALGTMHMLLAGSTAGDTVILGSTVVVLEIRGVMARHPLQYARELVHRLNGRR